MAFMDEVWRILKPGGQFAMAEFLLEKGFIDMVVDRRELKAAIARALRFMGAGPAATPPLEPAAAISLPFPPVQRQP